MFVENVNMSNSEAERVSEWLQMANDIKEKSVGGEMKENIYHLIENQVT